MALNTNAELCGHYSFYGHAPPADSKPSLMPPTPAKRSMKLNFADTCFADTSFTLIDTCYTDPDAENVAQVLHTLGLSIWDRLSPARNITHKSRFFGICQIQTNTIIGFPKPQVACSIHAGGTRGCAPNSETRCT